MSDISTSGDVLELSAFPHLTMFEWNALHRLAAVSGDVFVSTLLRSASPEDQRKAIPECLQRERDSYHASTPASSKSEVVKIDTSAYSGVGQDRLPLNRWFREIQLAMDARQLASESARANFLHSRLTGKAKEWALGKLVYDESAFPSLSELQDDLMLAFEPPQDESRMRAGFFALKQGKMAMRDYVLKARHLVSCVVTDPIDMSSQIHVFVFGMREGMTRYCLTRESPKTLKEAFALALRENYTVSSSYARPMSVETQANTPEPMELDAIEAAASNRSKNWGGRGSRGGRGGRGGRGPAQLICFRCREPRHRAAECRAPAPVLANIEAAVVPAADRTIQCHHFQWRLEADYCQPPCYRRATSAALLESGATNNFLRASCLSELPPNLRVREGPEEMVVKLADGKPRSVPGRAVSLSYEFDGFCSLDEFLVLEMNYAFDCILGMPWLMRYQPEIDWLSRSVKRRRDYDVSEVFAHLLVASRDWPHVTVVNPRSTTQTT